MDNPNTRPATSLRRHCSLPATASTSSSRIGSPSFTRTKKHNPYVGWFHHAAGKNLATRSKGAPTLLQQRQHQFKTSPYVGWFTHAPSQQHLLQSFTKAVIRACNDNNVLIWNESLLRSLWRLPGGNPKDSLGSSNNNNNKYGNTNNFTTTTSLTGSLFTKLTCWIFAPPKSHLYPRDYDKCCSSTAKTLLDDASVNNSSLGSDNDSDEESSTTSDTRFITNGNNSATELSVSSQAEAYYAHMTEKTATDYTEAGEHRLDVVITQMDILRMTRNASRHLDVQSILKLPTVVYNQELQAQQQQQPTSNATETPLQDTDKDNNNNNSSHEKESWSFVDVTDNNNNNAVCIRQDEVTTKNTAQPSDVCVICLEHYQHGESLRVLPCKHTFHVGCIDCWLSGSQSFDDCYTLGCPTCKRDVMSNTVPSWAFAQVGQSL